MLNQFKIGIFDSGIGGLTVARAIKDLCPNISLLYVGDTAHMPWGDKSKAHIISYSRKITEFLVEQGCNIIVVACNTASCNALADITKEFDNIHFFNVIDPIILFLRDSQYFKNSNLGIIGTKQTIRSGAYQRKITELLLNSANSMNIKALATPLLVPLVEEGLVDNHATNLILEQYLTQLNLPDKSVLILGCTHYPLIKDNIKKYYNNMQQDITIIDGSFLVAQQVKDFLHNNQVSYNDTVSNFYVTDDSEFFVQIANKFFGNIKLDFLPLWE